MRDLLFTLHSRRTRFPFAASFSAPSPDVLLSKITERIDTVRSRTNESLGVRAAQISDSRLRILGIFTGQGAQWARMGAEFISSSPAARKIIDRLDGRLARLRHPPSWTMAAELAKDATSSRIGDATLSQPLTLSVQILLVDIFEAAGVRFTAIMVHSSGKIAAAYAAKRISADDAICMSYYRGLSVAFSTQHQVRDGAMLAVGTSQDDKEELLEEPEFKDRAWIAAVNSSSSITISGDSDAIHQIQAVLQDEKKFTRRLKADRAYHSPHMLSYSSEYTAYQKNMSIQVNPASRTEWFSSVSGEHNSALHDELKGPYWIGNLINPVLFKQAVEKAWSDSGPFDMAVEIGPHPALKAPVQQVIQDITGQSLADGMGSIASHVGRGSVNLQAYEAFLSDHATFHTLQGLPPYSWDHSKEYWHESRYARALSHRSDKAHELLGHLTPDSSDREMRWRHSICPKEVPWLSGHRVQGQTVYPGDAFIVTVVEACLKLTGEQPVSLIEVLDIVMGQALTLDDDAPVEVVFTLSDIEKQQESSCIMGTFNCSAAKGKLDTLLDSLAHGQFRILLGTASSTALPGGSSQPTSLVDVDSGDLYASLDHLDYEFSGPFRVLSGLRRKPGLSTGFLPGNNTLSMLVHPAMLDALFQSIVLAASAPNDGRMCAAHIPNHIDTIRVNSHLRDA
ncbi:(acyl-carrier-protein) S-malonyltransferase domain protein [Metarhizium robertsii]|uniref:Polyketide synthase n=2 Tax=Metarhizium robertsii TaxID=568076 RepID=E9FD49_METRA|nr:polyketide synthase [Metarhizium robertsii ARSEF 23]EFY94354.1 polyketide synthase [Metarhizium robertsii ARSEF 23]EXU95767.1 (acyl-carrier-protein) S-malonyltransferase domain protein [Metarhizium robertsii]